MDKMKIIVNPISKIPQLKNSHVRGWSQVWAEQLKAHIDHKCIGPIHNSDELFIEHGVNYGGTLNLFGGADDGLFDRIDHVMKANKVTSLDVEMPNWGEQLRKRIGNATTSSKITEKWCDDLSEWCKKIPSLKQEQIDWLDGVSVGDSHTTSFSHEDDVVLRTNGKTLYGTLRTGLKNELRGMPPKGFVTFSLGSIDIRHHLMRHIGKHEFGVRDLIKEYVKQGREIEDEFGVDVWYAAPVPVEHEGRKLPKTGYYKGTPFFGSRDARLGLTMHFIELLNKYSDDKVIMPPKAWYNMDGEEYAKRFMEANSSVHISPEYYRRYNWGEKNNPLESLFGHG
jgi:hypothetical protein